MALPPSHMPVRVLGLSSFDLFQTFLLFFCKHGYNFFFDLLVDGANSGVRIVKHGVQVRTMGLQDGIDLLVLILREAEPVKRERAAHGRRHPRWDH
jgi:hypothetical protein